MTSSHSENRRTYVRGLTQIAVRVFIICLASSASGISLNRLRAHPLPMQEVCHPDGVFAGRRECHCDGIECTVDIGPLWA